MLWLSTCDGLRGKHRLPDICFLCMRGHASQGDRGRCSTCVSAVVLKRVGVQVLATSRTPYQSQAAAMGVTFYQDADDFCEEHPEVVVLATSILSLDGVLRNPPVQRLRRNTLFVDVLSVKEFPKRLLLAWLPPQVGDKSTGPFPWTSIPRWEQLSILRNGLD